MVSSPHSTPIGAKFAVPSSATVVTMVSTIIHLTRSTGGGTNAPSVSPRHGIDSRARSTPPRADALAAVGGADALVAETHPEDRNRRTEPAHDVVRNAGFRRRTRSRRNDDVAWRERLDLPDRDLVVAADGRVFAQLADVPG